MRKVSFPILVVGPSCACATSRSSLIALMSAQLHPLRGLGASAPVAAVCKILNPTQYIVHGSLGLTDLSGLRARLVPSVLRKAMGAGIRSARSECALRLCDSMACMLIWSAVCILVVTSVMERISEGECADSSGELFDAFFLGNAAPGESEASCWQAVSKIFEKNIDGVVGAQFVPGQRGRKRCQILSEDGTDPREEGQDMMDVAWTQRSCAAPWDCHASFTGGKGRGQVAGTSAGAATCLRLAEPNLRSHTSVSYQVVDGMQLENQDSASHYGVDRDTAVRVCQKLKTCAGISCVYPNYTLCSVRFSQRLVTAYPVYARSYIKWLKPRRGGLDVGYQHIIFFLHHKARSMVTLLLLFDLFSHLRLSVSSYAKGLDDVTCPAADVGFYLRAHPSLLAEFDLRCPNYRAVHVVRDPQDLVISAYRYHLLDEEGVDDAIPGSGKDVLSKLGSKDGIRIEAAAELEHTLGHMLGIQRQRDSRTITVKSEGLVQEFDAAVATILRHVMPDLSANELDAALLHAARHDMQRCASEGPNAEYYSADHLDRRKRITTAAADAFEQLRGEHDTTIQRVLETRPMLGYRHGRRGVRCKKPAAILRPFSGASFPSSVFTINRNLCLNPQSRGHYVLFDAGLRGVRDQLHLLAGTWDWADKLLKQSEMSDLIGICVDASSTLGVLEGSWMYIMDSLHVPPEWQRVLPPPPPSRIRVRVCQENAFLIQAWDIFSRLGGALLDNDLPNLIQKVCEEQLKLPANECRYFFQNLLVEPRTTAKERPCKGVAWNASLPSVWEMGTAELLGLQLRDFPDEAWGCMRQNAAQCGQVLPKLRETAFGRQTGSILRGCIAAIADWLQSSYGFDAYTDFPGCSHSYDQRAGFDCLSLIVS